MKTVIITTLYIWIALYLSIAKVYANPLGSNEAVHIAAHTGASYAITHATQVICKKALGGDSKLTCTLIGASTALAAGIVKEVVIDKGESNDRHAKGIIEDLAGIGLAVTFIAIDF